MATRVAFGSFTLSLIVFSGCSVFADRPVQEMSDSAYAIRAAREVQADTLAPELYRKANEWYFKARNEYQVRNFGDARDYAVNARKFAEEAEFQALKNGAIRQDLYGLSGQDAESIDVVEGGAPSPTPPETVTVEEYDKRQNPQPTPEKR